MDQTFRLRKSIKHMGMLFSAFFFAGCLGYLSLFFLPDPAKAGFKGQYAVVVVGGMGLVVFGSFLLMSLYLWAAYYVEKLTISGSTLLIRSMVQYQQFDVSELESLIWRPHPKYGKLIFRTGERKLGLDLYGFSAEDRLQIIQAVHELVPNPIQEGWAEFCHKVALPLRDRASPATIGGPPPGSVNVTRRRYDRMAAICVPLSVLAATILGASLNLWQLFVVPVLVIAAWLFLRFTVPSGGRSEAKLLSTSHGRLTLLAWSVILGVELLIISLRLSGMQGSTACAIGCIPLTILLIVVVIRAHMADKQKQLADKLGAQSAPDRWSVDV